MAKNLVAWTATEGENYEDLAELHGEMVGVWNRYIGHVATNIGGVYETLKTTEQAGVIYEPVAKETQKRSMQFMNEHVFTTPEWMLDKEMLRRVESAGAVDRVRSLQVRHLNNVLDMGRLQRVLETETFEADAYSILELMTDLRRGVWTELRNSSSIDIYRRGLQRAYLERMAFLMTEEQPPSRRYSSRTNVDVSVSDIRPVVKAALKKLQREVRSGLARSRNEISRYHLEDVADRIDDILNPND